LFQIESDDEQDASHVEIALEEDPRNDDVEEDSEKENGSQLRHPWRI